MQTLLNYIEKQETRGGGWEKENIHSVKDQMIKME